MSSFSNFVPDIAESALEYIRSNQGGAEHGAPIKDISQKVVSILKIEVLHSLLKIALHNFPFIQVLY
jgi:hypothetical protein